MEKILLGGLLMAVALVSGCQADAGPTQCPFANISIPEGSSKIIVPNISSYSDSLILCKKNHSSVCQLIASIRNGTLKPSLSAYMAHFSASEHGLTVVNATRFLIGEYQLCNFLRENCLQRFFLDVLGGLSHLDIRQIAQNESIQSTEWVSGSKHYGVIAAVALVVLLVLFGLWWKQRRGRLAHPSPQVPDTGDECLHPGATKPDGTRINTPSGEYGITVNGMLL